MRKPFYARTYKVGMKEFRFDRNFIDKQMNSANAVVMHNEWAYHDYKKRALFPKVSDPEQEHLRTKNRFGKTMGYVEF